jgi:transposase
MRKHQLLQIPITNGYTEGIKNRIKLGKRVTYGYRNFENQRIRILARCA